MARRKRYGVTMENNDIAENTTEIVENNEFTSEELSVTTINTPELLEVEQNTQIEEPVEINNTSIKEKDNLIVSENKMYTMVIKFDKTVVQVEYEVQATGQKDKMVAANKELRLVQGRFYLIPVEPFGVNSDDFGNLKVLSDMAKLIDVRYIKDGKACILPLRHNVTLKDGMRLCVIW